MSKLRFLFLGMLFLFLKTIHSQDLDMDSKDYSSSSEPAIILEEDNVIDIIGQKLGYISFVVTKKMKVKILSEEGVERFSNFAFPEAFDPTFIAHFPKDRNYGDALSELFVKKFQAAITTENGAYKKPVLKDTIEIIKAVNPTDNFYATYEKPHIEIANLEVGDVLDIDYKYEIRYVMNFLDLSSFRVFFNGDIPKEKYHLRISHHEKLETDITLMNMEQDMGAVIDGYRVLEWDRTNLSGCIDELGSRPYLELPYIVFSIKPYELLYQYYYSFEERFIPFYAIYAEVREQEHLGIARSVHQGVNNKQYSQINKFIKTQTAGIENDTLHYEELMKVHHTIAEEFLFDNDIAYFNKKDPRRNRIGDYLSKKTIRDISRYDLYVALILKLNLGYFSAYVCDIRVGELSNTYFAPMKDNDYFLAVVLDNGTIQYVYPKGSRYGFYLNEMPFYYEGSYTRLVSLGDYRNFKDYVVESNRQIKLPKSNVRDNQRKTNSMVKVNVDSNYSEFKTRINLSGQFSTMARGLYLYDIKDETVNDLYNTKVWELNKKVNHTMAIVEVQNKEFPFNTKISTSYSSNELLSKIGDTNVLDLSRMFNHIIYENFKDKDRKLDFYPDFLGQDTYVYFIQFSEDITIIDHFEEVNIKNEFGELSISIQQQGPRNLKISSNYVVKSRMVEVENIQNVNNIYSKVEELNHYELKFLINK